MKKVTFTLILAITIIVSGLTGYADHGSTASNKNDPGGGGFSIILDK
ncbi:MULTISPECIES: hypothetical protein [Bacillaceae]|jgi:hypothetical protein|nr:MULTISPECIES: hypothetical protein [Bacillaceae]